MLEKIALVTGGGSGIGRAAAHALADAGYIVAVVGRRQAALHETVETGPAPGRLVPIQADVSRPMEVERVFTEIRTVFGRLDLLFNNAGQAAPAVPLDRLAVEDWQTVIDSTLTSAFLCTRAAFILMSTQEPRGGRIINNGSVSAHAPRPHSAPYTAAKHGITGLTKSTALDGRAYDIACGQIDIGNAATAMTNEIGAAALQPDGTSLAEPRIDLEHVARAVVYMASLPLDANVLTMTLMATKMPLVGRG